MSNYTRQNMTPGNTADCYLPGCLGVTGGLCIGALPDGAPLNQTLWWCCTPYAETCRGGQSACPGTECSNDSATWCCNSELEACPGAGGLEGSCVPRDYPNPVLNGPAWGPDAVTSGTANGTSSSTTSTASGTPTDSGTTVIGVTQTETSAASSATGTSGGGGGESGGISAGAAAGVGVVGGGLFVLALVGCVWWFRRRGRAREMEVGGGTYVGGGYVPSERKPVEVEGQGLHEMEASIRSEMEASRTRSEGPPKSEHSA